MYSSYFDTERYATIRCSRDTVDILTPFPLNPACRKRQLRDNSSVFGVLGRVGAAMSTPFTDAMGSFQEGIDAVKPKWADTGAEMNWSRLF